MEESPRYIVDVQQLQCVCGEVYHITETRPGARIRCGRCDRMLDVAKASEASPKPPEAVRSEGRRRRKRAVRQWDASRWVALMKHPAGVSVLAYASVMLLVTVFLRGWGDVTSLGMLALFAPRTWLLVPWAVLIPWSLFVSWRLALFGVAGLIVGLFGVTTFEVPLSNLKTDGARSLRLVTFNTDRSALVPFEIRKDIADWDADLVLLQDCKSITGDSLRAITTMHILIASDFCVASRFPVDTLEVMPKPRPLGGVDEVQLGSIGRIRVRTPSGPLTVYTLHLPSPRTELWGALHLNIADLEYSIATRRAAARRAFAWVKRSDEVYLLAGDFNLPTGSVILDDFWGDLSDAFSVAGFGFGNTMFAGRFAVRIDHVLVPKTIRVLRAEVRRGYPTEHQPLIVDISWRGR